MAALENEILRLRSECLSLRHAESQLNQVGQDWKRCAVALIGPQKMVPLTARWYEQIGPGVFLWMVEHIPKQSSRLVIISDARDSNIPRCLEKFDLLTRELLLNCMSALLIPPVICLICTAVHENVAPTLDVSQSSGNGYARHIIPLSIESDMVRNALLATSASQIHVIRGSMAVRSLGYRAIAIRGLREASQQPFTDARQALFTLATILGLLIDDMINETKDFPALVKLADSWIVLNPTKDKQDDAFRQFMLDQIQMYDSDSVLDPSEYVDANLAIHVK